MINLISALLTFLRCKPGRIITNGLSQGSVRASHLFNIYIIDEIQTDLDIRLILVQWL